MSTLPSAEQIEGAITALREEIQDLSSEIESCKRRIDEAERSIARLVRTRALLPVAFATIEELLTNDKLTWPEQAFLQNLKLFGICDRSDEPRLRSICANHSRPIC